jgi:hypothetical protein
MSKTISVSSILVGIISTIGVIYADVINESPIMAVGAASHMHAYAYGEHTDLFKTCKGSLPEGTDILKILPSDVLKKGVNCIPQDFDKNGSLDFLIRYKGYSLFIFFKGPSVLRTQAIPDPILSLFDERDPARKRYPGHQGQAGLIQPDDGDGGHVYFLNPKTRLFEEVQYVPDPNHVYSD